jgi:glycosyltransferase involved in cell wall biosynthesis
VKVFYGFDTLPAPDQTAYGGIVKVQDLQNVFPNRPDDAGILYLVSSALPLFPVRMAKMARRAGVKIVLNQNGVAYPGWFGEGWREQNRPVARLIRMADHVIYQSRFCRASADRFLGIRKRACEVLYNPVDTEIFRPAASGAANGERCVNLLVAGSHQRFYRLRVAVEAFRHVLKDLPEARLIVAGRCSWQENQAAAFKQVKSLAETLGVWEKVQWLGPYTQLEAPEIFRRCHVLVHTKYNDPCPRLVVEAMASGLPVVYSATGGVGELVGEAAGVGVGGPLDYERDHPPDPQGMAAAIAAVVSRLPSYRLAARRRAVGHFDVRPWLQRHKDIFEGLVAR